MMYRTEVRLRTNMLGEPAKHIRPLSETRAIENGANALAEGFLFSVAAALIIGEGWRSSRSQSRRRDSVDDKLDELETRVTELTTRVESLATKWDDQLGEEKVRNDELARILQRVVEIGLRGGWAEFEDTPIPLPRVQLVPPRNRPPSDASNNADSSSPPSPESNDSPTERESYTTTPPQDTPPSEMDNPESSRRFS
ncbi:hypothetical protein HGRIS_013840 [Hohenbuehelia grisea]|uniref:OPA3-like protein n=1 Tax=Hohenbuehelia grisea TaxID=104357 RepID=A0ABR3IWZ5_9AGAR